MRRSVLTVALLLPTPVSAWPGPTLEVEGDQTEDFPIPDELEPAVRFWSDLFAKHDRSRVVLHDREHMEVVWEVIELPRKSGKDGEESTQVDEEAARKLVKKSIDTLQKRLRRLAAGKEPRDEEDEVLIALAGGPDSPRLAGAHTRVRAQRGVADKFREGLERARAYMEIIGPILEEEGVPAQIAALPFVESMYNPNARSSAGAVGLWQLMPATAKGLGLKISGKDERRDIEKSTRAAARMLRQNYEMLGSWPLAITGYNHGPYGVKRAVKAVGSTDLVYLIENYKKSTWGFASKNFYAEFLAATQVLSEKAEKPTLVQRETEAPAVQ